MKALTACLQLDPHVCEEFSWRRIQPGVAESDSEASSEDHDLVLHDSFSKENRTEKAMQGQKCR